MNGETASVIAVVQISDGRAAERIAIRDLLLRSGIPAFISRGRRIRGATPVLRIRAISSELLGVREGVFDPAVGLFRNAETDIVLTPTEARLLAYLIRAGGKPVPRGELLQTLLAERSDLTLENHIRRMRRKLHDGGEQKMIARTAAGYVFSR